MEKYNEIISKSLIDFEEIKLVFANNNIKLVNSYQVKERYFLDQSISFKTANYKKILENSYIFSEINEKKYLCYKSKSNEQKEISKIEIVNEVDCIEFLNHIGLKETFSIEKNIYSYTDGLNEFSIINLINLGLYVSAKKENATVEELKEILSSFHIPYNESECDESIEKLVISKVRRYLK